MRVVRSVFAVGGLLAVMLIVGCGPGAKDQQIQALQDANNRLLAENADLKQRLQQALAERDQARAALAQLQQQPVAAPRQRGEWTEYKGFAWQDLPENILFDSGKANIKPDGIEKLQKVLADLKQNWPERQVWIVGHTDTDPIKHSKWADNLELSVERGAAVFRELQKMGVDPTRMVAAGQGQWNPKVPNTSATNKKENRRVQIIAVEVPQRAGIPPTAQGRG
jgi:chemotaxis protein MotB